MAFSRAAGYGNLPNGNFTPVIYSQKVLKAFRKASVVEDITNTDYAGEIANYGDTVNIIQEPDIAVYAYSRGQQVVTEDLQDNQIQLIVDHANAFAFKIDDIEAKQSHLNWESLASNRAAYKLKDAFDSEVLTNMSGQALAANVVGSSGAPTSIKASGGTFTPLAILARLNRLMDVQNVPTDDRWFVGDPIFWELMSDENSKLIPVEVTGDPQSVLRNGKVTEGLIRGFKCYKSNNLPSGGTGSGGTGANNFGTLIAGHMSSTATVSQIAKTESFRDPDSFADVVRGLHMYGRKVLRPEALCTVTWNST